MKIVQEAYLIVYVMILTFITMSVGLSVLSVSGNQYTFVVDNIYRQDVANGAKACAYIATESLNEDQGFAGFTDKVIFDDLNSSGGYVSCTLTISDGPNNTKLLDIHSSMYRFSDDPHPIRYRVSATVSRVGDGGGTSGSTDYLKGGLLVGNSGLYTPILVNITSDNINVAGKLYISGYSSINLGSSSSPIPDTSVANVACGSSSDWPQHCTDQPINAFIYPGNFQNIYGKVCAPDQTENLSYFKGAGLQSGCQVTVDTMPSFDKKTYVSGMTNTLDASTLMSTKTGGCLTKKPLIPGFPAFGYVYEAKTVNIPPNTRINGSLDKYYDDSTPITNMSLVDEFCSFVFQGDSYVTGSIGPVVYVRIADSASSDINMVINGKITVSKYQDKYKLTPNSSGKLMHIISFYSNNATCSNSDVLPSTSEKTCLTNAQAKQSSAIQTNGIPTDPALVFVDSPVTYTLSGATFYAYYGSVGTGCNTINIAALGAQGVGGGCGNLAIYSNITITEDDPGFGDLTPSSIAPYSLSDMHRS